MGKFHIIETKLKRLADDFNAEFHTDGFWIHGIPEDKIEGRRITWKEGIIGKGIFIEPYYGAHDTEPASWDFTVFAWLDDGQQRPKGGVPCWQKHLLDRVDFSLIENAIDDLLIQSAEILKSIERKDLRLR